ncbi:acetyl-/propionyl-CoA carboxylase subunit alpha, partial [Georgenia sp. 10Sc9-8]|nr:acetyl-/propionyl-CoA carboxylase subunit alpha [Georgenia halotolerans]
LERARRALRETDIVGFPTVLPFHRDVLTAPDFVAADGPDSFRVHTTWIETDYAGRLRELPSDAPAPAPVAEAAPEEPATERVVVEVGGKRLEVVLPVGLGIGPGRGGRGAMRRPSRRNGSRTATPSAGGLRSPMQGTIVKVAVAEGDAVDEGDLVVVLEAMKMEQPLLAHRAGRVQALKAEVGATISSGTVICEIEPAG